MFGRLLEVFGLPQKEPITSIDALREQLVARDISPPTPSTRTQLLEAKKLIETLELQIADLKKLTQTYPLVAYSHPLAQGTAFCPKVGWHFEFFRIENRMCFILPFNMAQGIKPADLLPLFLDIDTDEKIESSRDKVPMAHGGSGTWDCFIIKIPIKGWGYRAEKDFVHPSYDLNGQYTKDTFKKLRPEVRESLEPSEEQFTRRLTAGILEEGKNTK